MTPMDPASVGTVPRSQVESWFSALRVPHYMNFAGMSPLGLPVREAMAGFAEDWGCRGNQALSHTLAVQQRLRARLAALLGVAAEDMGWVMSAGRGVSAVALCFPWRRGDRVLLFDGEFPANVTPWQRAAQAFDLEVRFSSSLSDFGRDWEAGLETLAEDLGTHAPRLVAVSAVQFQTGLRMPLKEMARLCHDAGAELFVDGIQACGVVPLDLSDAGVDYFSCGSHKWMLACEGAGFLYVRRDRCEALRPLLANWLSHEASVDFLTEGSGHMGYSRGFRTNASVFEGTSMASVAYAGLSGAMDMIEAMGVGAIFDHVQQVHDALEAGLVDMGFVSLRPPSKGARSGNLCFELPRGLRGAEWFGGLAARGLVGAYPDGRFRLSPHVNVTVSQVPRVLELLRSSLAGS